MTKILQGFADVTRYPTSKFISLLFGNTQFTSSPQYIHPDLIERPIAVRHEKQDTPRHCWEILANVFGRVHVGSFRKGVVFSVRVVDFPNNSKTFGQPKKRKPKILHKRNSYVIQGSKLACELVQPLLETKVWQCQRLMC